MPEQQSNRGDAVTQARFTGPFEQHLVRCGTGSLNLHDSLDVLEGWSRLTNVEQDENGDLTGRAGQTALATGGTQHHSVRALRDPQAGTTTRVWGIDTQLYRGASGALTAVDAGYSGSPLTLVPHRPPLSGDPWMYVADRQRMRKMRADGLVVPIGLPAPGSAAAASFAGFFSTNIVDFGVTDGTEAATWTPAAGTDQNGVTTDPPLVVDEAGPFGPGVEFQTVPGAVTTAYDSWWGIPIARNLETLGGGAVPATDDDLMHFWVQIDLPHKVEEIRLYLVVSPDFDPAMLPGTDDTGAASTIGYVKAIRQYDFAAYLQGEDAQINVAESALTKTIRDEELEARRFASSRTDLEALTQQQRDAARTRSFQASGAAREWVRFGYFEIPLRRGDFQRFGTSAQGTDPDWGTVTGAVVYVRTVDNTAVRVRLDQWFIHGGYGIDSTAPGAQPYDWRYTHYDPRTGAEGNPSPIMTPFLDVDRKPVTVDPAPYGDPAVRQRIYRRGGSLIDDWYYVGQNSSDGGVFTDELSDSEIAAAGTVAIDHYQPVPTVTDAGVTVLAQPLPSLWGPIEGMLMGCGDPYRPGHLYYSQADQPDHWSASGNVEVCPPSEELLSGGISGHQGYVFSRQRLYLIYPNLGGTVSVTASPSLCTRGPIGRWAHVVGPGGIYFVAEDGIFVTTGGPEEWLSRPIDPLFKGKARNGYLAIDLVATATFQSLTIWENKLYFLYQDTSGARQVWVYDLLLKTGRHYQFGRAPQVLQGHGEDLLLIGGLNTGTTYQHVGTSDAGLPIATVARTGSFSGGVREEKLLGDQFVDAAPAGIPITIQNFLNEETVANLTQTVDGTATRQRFILDAFGEVPQRVRSIATEVRWSTDAAPPVVYQFGYAITPQPDVTMRRVTNWDDLGHPDESWVTGVTLDCDTGGQDKTVLVERDFNGVREVIATLIVNCNTRHKRKFSWPATSAHQMRLRPADDACAVWVLYRADWISVAEPPRIARWDIHFENTWDTYYTGLDLYCDTEGLEKRIEISIDGTVLTNPATGLAYFPVVATGRRVVHLTLPWGRGHVLRFRAIDENPGLLYQHRWHLHEEPSEQANWNQPFTILGTQSDKYLKAVIYEVDTFGVVKNVGIEIDGVVVETQAVQTSGRRVVQLSLSQQRLGRVFRFFPQDLNPSRLYTIRPVFDEEPFQLHRWETQETNHGLPGWFTPLWGHVTLKSTAPVTLSVTQQYAQETNRTITERYVLASTLGVKLRRFVTFKAQKGVLIKYVLTSPAAFHLYREETYLRIQPWGQPDPIAVQPFGNSDSDTTRSMINSTLAAQASGGGSA